MEEQGNEPLQGGDVHKGHIPHYGYPIFNRQEMDKRESRPLNFTVIIPVRGLSKSSYKDPYAPLHGRGGWEDGSHPRNGDSGEFKMVVRGHRAGAGRERV